MRSPFIGVEAMASGSLTRHRLRTDYSPLLPGIYVSNEHPPTLDARITAVWLWSKRRAVIAGAAAAAMHGSRWVDDDVAIELISANTRPPKGVVAYNDALFDGEVVPCMGICVTSIDRTGFDLGRRGSQLAAVARLDALCRATGLPTRAVEAVAARHPGARGSRQLRSVLALVDPGAESPKETWLRLLLIRAGLPKPKTQITVVDGSWVARLDMGWEDVKVAVEYDGEQHRTDRRQYHRDIKRLEKLQRLGWIVIRVTAEDHPQDALQRVRQALDSRGYRRG
jgi:very-short-patch-repair endonuclease